jgi:hypothetical protein
MQIVSNIATKLASLATNPSAFLAKSFLDSFGDFLYGIIRTVCQYIYFVAKWLLYSSTY